MQNKTNILFHFHPSAQQLFWCLIVLTLFIKLYIAYIVPITGDEAEYVYWSQHLAWGYYDHPPMIAWMLAPFSAINLSNIWLRLPQILTSTIISIGIVGLLKNFDAQKAYLIAILYLISPVSIFNQAILTDTPLILFTFLSIIVLFIATTHQKSIYYFLAGILLGAAFFSKYLMFPVAGAIFIFFLFSKNLNYKWRNFMLLLLGTSPFVLQNIFWNYHYDWVNFLFNLDLRNVTTTHFKCKNPILYALSIIYLYSPIIIYYIAKKINVLYRHSINRRFSLFILTGILPILFYFALSFLKRIGLHWIFCAYPFLFITLFIILDPTQLKKCIKFMGFYTGIQLIACIVILNLPLSVFQNTRHHNTINWFLNFETVAQQIKPYLDQNFILATPSYAQSYLLSYKQNRKAVDWGVGSVHGRQDDLSTDFKTLEQKNILIFDLNHKLNLKTNVQPYFKSVTIKSMTFNGTPYRIFLGTQFNYIKYRDNILHAIYKKYYNVPDWLPRSRQYYQEKYFNSRHATA